MPSKTYYVYTLASPSGTLYIGMTSDIRKRLWQHKEKLTKGFTQKHNITRLLYVETFVDPMSAITREKQIKAYRREKKVALIDLENPEWRDLSKDW
ncbi:MAG: GIY-YIG nuclease family protein [Planctomycetes bacterium]|nr:GIY-YIG nuclease family protein [Planctomycetota bacterium]